MYDRTFGDSVLNFEPSGGLLDAALVMRDRETNSWWAIMRGQAIGGVMNGRSLRELSIGEKTTWGDWRRRHPETLVLSVQGRTHVTVNHYENYFKSDGTFRGLKVSDERLPAKEPIFAFRHEGRAFAIAHRALLGGRHLALPGPTDSSSGRDLVFLFRDAGASPLASTRAYIVPEKLIVKVGSALFLRDRGPGRTELRRSLGGPDAFQDLAAHVGVKPLGGFDTFWYTWVAVNAETVLLP